MTHFLGKLTFKIGVFIILAEAIVLGVVGSVYSKQFAEQVDKRIEFRAKIPGTLFKGGLLKLDTVGDQQMMEKLIEGPLLDGLVVGANSIIFHSLNPDYIGSHIEDVPDIDPKLFDLGATDVRTFLEDEHVTAVSPIFASDGQTIRFLAYIKVGTLAALAEKSEISNLLVIGSFFTIIITSLVIILLFRVLILNRISDVLNVLTIVGAGDFDVRLTGRLSQDELGQLQDRVNLTVDELEQTVSYLRQHVKDLKIAETASANDRNMLRTLIDNLPDYVYVKDLEGHFLTANTATAELMGNLSPADLTGKNDAEFYPLNLAAAYHADEQSVIQSGRALLNKEEPAIDSDGNKRWIVTSKIPLKDNQGRVIGLVGIGRDITERKKLRKQVRRSQKMDAVGQLTGGIAHDFNNILAIILGSIELLQDEIDDGSPLAPRIDDALKATMRGARLTRKLLAFSRKDASETTNVMVNDHIDGLKELVEKSLTASISIETNLCEELWPVEVDSNDFEDAILNLSLNARDAMPDGGALVIETDNKTIDQSYVDRNPGATAGEFVMISISDTGLGMSSEVMEKVLEPFYTTKEQGKGTGLGLSMVYAFVERSHGHLKIYSEVGKGSVIRFYLPRAQVEVGNGNVIEAKPNDRPRGAETVLIVDDEVALLKIASSMLQGLGYKTFTAQDGRQALEILNGNKEIDLLFSDVVMPGDVDGYQLAIAAVEINSSIQVLLASGFTKRRDELGGDGGNFYRGLTNSLLNKPYNKSELAIAVRLTLDKNNMLDLGK